MSFRLCSLGVFIEVNTLFSLIQLKELKTKFEEFKGEKAVPARWLKSQQQKQAKVAAEEAVGRGDGEGEIVANDEWNNPRDAMIQTAVADQELTEVMILRFDVFFTLSGQ